ncbi:MAG: phosphoribosylglycinamide formyltransferase [Fuerstiella sp.]
MLLPSISNRPVRLGVLLSGGGTTLLNLLDCINNKTLAAEVRVVVTNQPACKGRSRSEAAGLPTFVQRRSDFDGLADYSRAIFDVLQQHDVDLVIMAGFLSMLQIPEEYQHQVLNIHPSLIPSFCGKGMYGHHVHEAVKNRGVKLSGCTVHFANNQYDEGPIVLQRPVAIPDHCSADDIAALVFEQERVAYPEAIRRVISGRLEVTGRSTIYHDSET